MLHHISTGAFIEAIILAMVCYYTFIGAMFYPKEIWNWLQKRIRKQANNQENDQLFEDNV